MNIALIGKIMGWAQFALQFFSGIGTQGLPHGFVGWSTLVGSLLTAIGVHAATKTDGTK
jgi:hypothetical protein